MEQKSLYFHGPYKFNFSLHYLFDSEYAQDEGIYLWVLKDRQHNLNYIEYIGETLTFANRQKQHLINILGLNYRIIDVEAASKGKLKVIWPGLWRNKTKDGVGTLLENYDEIKDYILSYISYLDIYLAPTKLEMQLRRHIEGCIGWNLRNNYPQYKKFYPDDNHIGTYPENLCEVLKIESAEPILGLDSELLI